MVRPTQPPAKPPANGNGAAPLTPEEQYKLELDQLKMELVTERRAPRPWHQGWRSAPTARGEDDNAWLLTYLDMLTLLLTMFVVLLSYAKNDAERYRRLSHAVAQEMRQMVRPAPEQKSEEERLAEQMNRTIVQQKIGDNVEVLARSGSVELRVKDKILFDTGAADLQAVGGAVLDKLIPLLRDDGHQHMITVEGHTDNVPIANDQFASNWELSAVRATNVVRHLIAMGIKPEHIAAVGYADTHPIAENATAEGRAQNRRVAIVISMEPPGTADEPKPAATTPQP